MQHCKLSIGLTFGIKLPDREAKTALRAVKAQDLAAPALGIHGHACCTEYLGESIGTQHVIRTQNLGGAQAATLARRSQRRRQFRVRSFFQNRLSRGNRPLERCHNRLAFGIDIDAEADPLAGRPALGDRIPIALQERLYPLWATGEYLGRAVWDLQLEPGLSLWEGLNWADNKHFGGGRLPGRPDPSARVATNTRFRF